MFQYSNPLACRARKALAPLAGSLRELRMDMGSLQIDALVHIGCLTGLTRLELEAETVFKGDSFFGYMPTDTAHPW